MKTLLKKLRLSVGKFEVIAFVSGFALMAYEMVASRLLAPSIGSSIYVWTSVIGVMIAALAIGYTVGGWLADKRVAERDIAWLLIISAIAMAGTLSFYAPTLGTISEVITDQRWQGIAAAIALFMPASFVLGMISPYLARLRVKSLATTGRSVAALSAFNSVGGIVGTFCAGFIFFSLIGSRETLALSVALLIGISWLILPSYRFMWRVVVSVCVGLMLALQIVAPVYAHTHIATVETPTAHYDVQLREYRGQQVRVLATDPYSYQSGVLADGSKELVFDYTKKIMSLIDAVPNKDKILILGGGAYTLPEAVGKKYPKSQIDVIEIDPELREVSKKYFNYDEPANVRAISMDARAFLHEAKGAQYDIAVIDVYGNDVSIPFVFTTHEYTAELKAALKDSGIVVANLIAGVNAACSPLLASLTASYATAFTNYATMPASANSLGGRENMILVAANQPIDWVRSFGPLATAQLSAATTLADNFAPVEPLVQQCREGR